MIHIMTWMDPTEQTHRRPSAPITPAVQRFIDNHAAVGVVGLEAWQTYYDLVGQRGTVSMFQSAANKAQWDAVVVAVLTDFAVWYDSGHYLP